MLGTVFGSFLSGQFLSRTGGHYRIQGAIGVAILAVGMFLLSRMNVTTSHAAAVRNIIIAGFGQGITMPLYIIAVQNAVPYNFLGSATSVTAFTRSIGGTVGLSIFGSVMSSRFAAELAVRIPPEIKTVVPQQQLDAIVHNPQALFSTEAQNQLQGIFSQFGQQGAALFQNLLQILRESLSAAINHVFLIAFFAVVLGFIVNLFIKEIPLRTHHTMDTDKHLK
jgi:hypothetical protein